MKAPRPQKYSDKFNAINEKTLRDEFAMAALTGLACIDCVWKEKEMAKYAYELADDMLEVRKQ